MERDVIVLAREAFAAYRGLGRDIIEDMIREIQTLRTNVESYKKVIREYRRRDLEANPTPPITSTRP